MADNQVNFHLCSMRDHSKSKKTFSWTVKNSSPRRPVLVLDSIRMLVWVLELPRKPLNLDTLTRNAPSLPMSPSEARFSRVLSSPIKCKELLLWEETIYTTFLNITDMRRDTETSQCTAPLLLLSRKETLLLLDNADLLLKLFTLIFSRLSPTKLLVTLENSLCSSDVYTNLID